MKGVNYNKKKRKYDAYISYKGKKYFLGSSIFIEEAMMLRKSAEIAKSENRLPEYFSLLRGKLMN